MCACRPDFSSLRVFCPDTTELTSRAELLAADPFLAPGATAAGAAALGLLSAPSYLDSKTHVGRVGERAGLTKVDFAPFQRGGAGQGGSVDGGGGGGAVGGVVEAGGRGPGVRASATPWVSPGKAHVTPGLQTLGYTRAAQGALVVRQTTPSGLGASHFSPTGAAAIAQRVGAGVSLRARSGGGWGEPGGGFEGGLAVGMNHAVRQQVGRLP